jgi:hypothetical protein
VRRADGSVRSIAVHLLGLAYDFWFLLAASLVVEIAQRFGAAPATASIRIVLVTTTNLSEIASELWIAEQPLPVSASRWAGGHLGP